MSTRRDFLASSTLLGFGATVPGFLGRTALAAPAVGKAGAKDTILVVVQLTGGNDGLNTVIPFKDADYAKYRPTIGVKKNEVKKVDDSIGLHPAMADLAGLLEDQALCVVQGVGYPNPSQSHFRSMDVWQAASTAETVNEGWLGKALKQKELPGFHLSSGGNEVSPLALVGAPARVPSVTSIEDFQLKTTAADAADKTRQKKLIEAAANGTASGSAQPNGANLLDFVQRTALNTYASSQRLQEVAKNYQPKSPYPGTALANRLKLAAQLIDAGTGARLFYVSLDGFDTHAGQGGANGTHANLLREVSGAIAAFYKDLAARGHKDRVCVMTFSEFGRRAKENGSNGTDHGSAAPMFLVGGRVTSGVVGSHPSLSKLEDGNLVHAIDFRRVYAAVLDQWLGVDAKAVLGSSFEPVKVFKNS
ncbi:DUF1501 domain-containing protein [Fimbriiglobus ruber]|uniref:DUF1501 domain-containing protein n=1 Tax=Fimbriiglobus ruber TaxID=1908690 RepID=A0A225EBE7_9BACT|nr:DUF1501 domain-containing protein [Fimbriiglobus ruber]OWK46689.1 hypothetical protein FRUB_00388 [Fimbriiglobus ruber]